MQSYKDVALNFECDLEQLFGVLSVPAQPAALGIVLIVGGPQYRVGSHRQFARLARSLAQAGFAVLRFDYRGMGDSSGAMRDFENIDADIRAAIDAFLTQCPEITNIALWGLCDAASAACMYAVQDHRVGGLVLLNPWVRDASTYARIQVKHYYGARVLQKEFWQKLGRGDVRVFNSLRESLAAVFKSIRRAQQSTAAARPAFQSRMLQGLQAFSGHVLLLVSGRDLTAQEFIEVTLAHPQWRLVLQDARFRRVEFPEADHTFSTRAWKTQVEAVCSKWLQEISRRQAADSNERI